MTQNQIDEAISEAFLNLSNLNEMLYDYWISKLYSEDGDMNRSQWDQSTVAQMEDDVMQQTLITNQ